jgi:hypothetical protein
MKSRFNESAWEGVRTLDHSGHLLDTGDIHVVLVETSSHELEVGELVKLDEIDNAAFEVADVQRASDLVALHPELQLVILIHPEVPSVIPDRPSKRRLGE